MKRILLATAFVLGFGTVAAQAEPVKYEFDKRHTSIEFYINHLGLSNFQSEFQEFDGTLLFDAEKPENSSVEVSIAVDSIETDVPALNDELKNEEWFNTAQFPKMTFKSKSIEVTGEKTGKITGDLTLHGVTKEVVLDTTLNYAGPHPFKKFPVIGFSATTEIKRSDFGITKFIPAVGDEVKIRIETEAMNEK